MHQTDIQSWQHDHSFGQDKQHRGEKRTSIVVGLTCTMMFVEIAAGIIFGSMALRFCVADGLGKHQTIRSSRGNRV